MAKIIPGVLTDDENTYKIMLTKAESVSDLVQIDVIDGEFAPNTTIGTDVIRKHPPRNFLEVQLMVVDPKKYIEELVGLDFVTRIIFPYEVKQDQKELIIAIKKAGRSAALSINPETPVGALVNFFAIIDFLCIFSNSPGFSGKALQETVFGRIKDAKLRNSALPVEIDIGVNFETAPKLAQAGADFLIATSALQNAPDIKTAYEKLATCAQNPHN